MLTMAHRLASNNIPLQSPGVASQEHVEAALRHLASQRQSATEGTVFNIDNVAEFYLEKQQGTWDPEIEFPCLMPPFGKTLMQWEWTKPLQFTIQGKPMPSRQAAVLFSASETNPDMITRMASLTCEASGYCDPKAFSESIAPAISSKWTVVASVWLEVGGAARFYPPQLWMWLDNHGKPVLPGYCWLDSCIFNKATKLEDEVARHCSHLACLAVSFANCKNVSRSNVTAESNPPAKWLRRQKCPEIKCYTLDINPMKQVLRTEGGIETNGLKKALHICRGHFAHYTDENPLFGRITGTFWKPQHVRGSKEFGEVKKDYRIKV